MNLLSKGGAVRQSVRRAIQIDTSLAVRTSSRTYTFDAGVDLLVNPEYWTTALKGPAPVALLTSPQLLQRFPRVASVLGDPLILTVPDGEPAKSLDVAANVYRQLVEVRFPRTGVLVGLGGGSMTDLAGFVAGTWKRGVRLIQAPTTLTSQVDAALGGKAGVNLPEGKNLVGVIYQPERVVADRTVLQTVPERDFVAGMAEIIKCGYIADPEILTLATQWSQERLQAGNVLAELIYRSVRVKLNLIEQDEVDLDVRRHLNYGHTLGQALEAAVGYRGLNHGEAVGLGMLFAAAVGELANVASGLVASTRRQLQQAGLPIKLPPGISFETVWALMAHDKKGGLQGREFVICDRPGAARLTSMPREEIARKAFAAISCPASRIDTA